MHILVVHQYYLAAGHPGGSRFNALARLWTLAGHRVTVITGNRDHGSGNLCGAPLRGLWRRELDGDVEVWRVWVPAAYGRGYVGRACGYGGFAASAMCTLFAIDRPDVIIASSPPLPVILPGLLARRRFGGRPPLIFEMRDLWPESAVTTGVLPARSPITMGLYALERWGCQHAQAVCVVTPAFIDDLRQRDVAPAEKIVLVENGADEAFFLDTSPANGQARAKVRTDFGFGERFVALYAGAHGRANDLGQLIAAAERLRHRPDILIACVGDGSERRSLQHQAAALQLTNIKFYGPVAKERMPHVIAACEVGIAVLQDNPTFKTVYPNKIFDYMAGARAVVVAIDGSARRLVCDTAAAGVFVSPNDPDASAHALTALADDPLRCRQLGTNGRDWVRRFASREALAARYLQAMQELCATGHLSPLHRAHPAGTHHADLSRRAS